MTGMSGLSLVIARARHSIAQKSPGKYLSAEGGLSPLLSLFPEHSERSNKPVITFLPAGLDL